MFVGTKNGRKSNHTVAEGRGQGRFLALVQTLLAEGVWLLSLVPEQPRAGRGCRAGGVYQTVGSEGVASRGRFAEGFLFIVTRNLVFNQYRKEVNEDYYKMTVLSALESSYDIEEEIAARDLSRYIDRLIEELPEKRRQIFNLSRKAHKSHKEIALLLGISEKTVENQIREALRFLRKNMLLLICFLG